MWVPPNHPFEWIVHYKPSILGYHHLWKPSYSLEFLRDVMLFSNGFRNGSSTHHGNHFQNAAKGPLSDPNLLGWLGMARHLEHPGTKEVFWSTASFHDSISTFLAN